jgi:hypothetical protein
MKKSIITIIAAALMFTGLSAQSLSFGIKGGLNYSKLKFDDIKNITSGGTNYNLMQDEAFQGFHIGVMGRLNVLNVFVQPELLFNTSGGKVLVEEIQGAGNPVQTVKEIKYNKLDLPVMVGMKFGIARVNLGPVASVVLSSNSQVADIVPGLETKSKGATLGFQAGAGLDLFKELTLDLRYEGGLSKLGDKLTVAGQDYAFDSRDSKVVVSVGFFF